MKFPDANFAPEQLPFGAMLEEQLQLLAEVDKFVSTMRVTGKKKLLPFQEGILMSCRALPILHKFLQDQFPDEKIEICTTHLNQDVLEQLFALVRMLGGHISNPSPLEFVRRLRNILLGRCPEVLLNQRGLNVDIDPAKDGSQLLNLEVTAH